MPQVPTYAPNQVADDATLKATAEPLPAADFGTQLTEGGQAVAGALDDQAKVLDEAAAKGLTDQYSSFREATLYGPNGLDKLQGQNYINALPDVQRQLKDQRDQIIGQATTQRQRMMLNDSLGARLNADLQSTSAEGDAQLKNVTVESSTAHQESDLQQAQATYFTDPTLSATYLNNARTEAVRLNDYLGMPDAVGAQKIVALQTKAYGGIATRLMNDQRAGAAGEAVQFLHAHLGEMDPTTWGELNRQAMELDAANSATPRNAGLLQSMTGASADTSPAAAAPAQASSYLSAVRAHEGTTPDPNSSAQRGFIKATWLSTLKTHPEFANDIAGKTDDQLLQLRATDPALADRATLALGRDSAAQLARSGMAPTSANVFLMQWFGPGDGPKVIRSDPAAPITSIISPATAAKNGLTGKTVGQVIAGVQHRFGNGPFGASAGAPADGPSDAVPAPTGTPYRFVSNIVAGMGGDAKAQHDLAAFKLLESGASMDPPDRGALHGIYQFDPAAFKAAFPGGDFNSAMDQTKAAYTLYQQNRTALTSALGREPTTLELYMSQHISPAGVAALLTAPPDVSAVAALTPAYAAHGAAAGVWAASAVGKNGGASSMTAGQFLSYWQNRASQQLGDKVQATAPVADPAATDPVSGAAPTLPTRDVYMAAVARNSPDPNVDPRGYRASMADGESQWARANEAQNSREQAAVAAVQPLMRDPTITTYAQFQQRAGPQAMASLPEGTQTTIYEHFNNMTDGGLPKVSDRATVTSLHDLYTSDPKAFANRDLTPYSKLLNNQDWQWAHEKQDALRKGLDPDMQHNIDWGRIHTAAADVFTDLQMPTGRVHGVVVNKAQNDAYLHAVSTFKADMLSRVALAQREQPGKPVTDEQIHGWATELAGMQVQGRGRTTGWFGDKPDASQSPFLSYSDAAHAPYVPYLSIPPAARVRIQRDYIAKHGHPASQEYIEDFYPQAHALGVL